MTPERWQQIEAVLQDALDRPPQERAVFLVQACGADDDLRSEAALLIQAHDEAADFIEQPAISTDASVLATAVPDLNIGRQIGAYRLVKRLGSGGMGEVYLAEDSKLARLVALKILPANVVADESRLRRFQREARAVSALNHPNILTIHEVAEAEGIHFIATEYIDGQTIRDLISERSLTADEVFDITLQVGAGLAAAHAAGIIHRDVKPENIMRRSDGIVRVLDFGIAKPIEQQQRGISDHPDQSTQTEMGVVLGTTGYMSPEQARGLSVDPRTDVWSFGVVLYELITRRAPFAAPTRMDTLVSILEHEPGPLFQTSGALPEPFAKLQAIVKRALSKDLHGRYNNVAAMLEDLRALKQEFQDNGILTVGLALDEYLVRFCSDTTVHDPIRSRRKPILAVAAVILLAAIVVLAFTLKSGVSTPAALSVSTPAGETFSKPYREMTEAERLGFVGAQAQRVSAMLGEHPGNLNTEAVKAIKRKVDNYLSRTGSVSNQPGREDLRKIYNRAPSLVPLIAKSFEARKVPVTIGIYLPMIEAEYRPCSESQFGAKGLFQLLPSTAQQYGVAPNEMCDAEKMTPAAADYIADRMAELGEDSESMTLVLLSYNRGSTWVRDSLVQLRSTENFERNFWTLFAHRDKLDESFRKESAGYVPMFFAAAIIGENPRAFELETPALSTLATRQPQTR